MLPAIHAALVPLGSLSSLANLRTVGDVSVVVSDRVAWVSWDSTAEKIITTLLAVPGAEYFSKRNDRWHRFGETLPAFDVPPAGKSIPLERFLFPAPVTPIPPEAIVSERVLCRLVSSTVAAPTTAMRCDLIALKPWMETATSFELSSVRACLCDSRAFLLGSTLPWIETGERFWGNEVLIPLGYRPDPDWSEAALREAAGVARDQILVLGHEDIELIPRETLEPLSRARWREAVQQLSR